MRLRTLIAPTMAQAMDLLRRELGEDAIIVSTENTDTGTKIVAAIEEDEPDVPSVTVPGRVTVSKKPCGAKRARAAGNWRR